MRIAGFDFTPGPWPSLATLLLLPVLVYLGIWQLERAAWKQALIDASSERTAMAPVPLELLPLDREDIRYRPVTARGRYDLGRQLLLDNRTSGGRAGYHVLTPLVLEGAGGAVLVNRGWVPTGASRAQLPALPGPEEVLVVNAIVKLPPEKFLRLDDAEEVHAGWPQVVQQLKLSELEARLDYALLPVILLLDPEAEHGFVRAWQAVHGIIPDKHRAYALQWFTLALVLLVIYIGVNTKRATQTH